MLKWTHKTELSTFVPLGQFLHFCQNLRRKDRYVAMSLHQSNSVTFFLPNPRLPLISSKSVGFSEDIVQVVGLGFGFRWCGEGLSRATGGKQGFPKGKKHLR